MSSRGGACVDCAMPWSIVLWMELSGQKTNWNALKTTMNMWSILQQNWTIRKPFPFLISWLLALLGRSGVELCNAMTYKLVPLLVGAWNLLCQVSWLAVKSALFVCRLFVASSFFLFARVVRFGSACAGLEGILFWNFELGMAHISLFRLSFVCLTSWTRLW